MRLLLLASLLLSTQAFASKAFVFDTHGNYLPVFGGGIGATGPTGAAGAAGAAGATGQTGPTGATGDPTVWTRISSVLTTRVTAPPASAGQYRTYLKDVSANTGTDGAPTVGPSSTNGMLIYCKNYATAGTSGQVNRWQMYIGTGKMVRFQVYTTTGFSGGIEIAPIYYGTIVKFGLDTQYDSSTGIATIDCIEQASSVTSRVAGSSFANAGGSPDNPASVYFDVLYQ
jgi:hypothetical protein